MRRAASLQLRLTAPRTAQKPGERIQRQDGELSLAGIEKVDQPLTKADDACHWSRLTLGYGCCVPAPGQPHGSCP